MSPRPARSPRLYVLLCLVGLLAGVSACGGDPKDGDDAPGDQPRDPNGQDPGPGQTQDPNKPDDVNKPPTPEELANPGGWFGANTVSHRVALPVAGMGSTLNAQQLAIQLAGYDPGSLLRCDVSDAPEYKAAIDRLGGVTWGYQVQVMEDLSKPRFQAGLPRPVLLAPTAGNFDMSAGAAPVEIVKPDIVAVTEDAALFYSSSHGLMLVNLTGAEPTFECATQLPGVIDQFFFKDGHLVAMAKQQRAAGPVSFLLHFVVDAVTVRFVEAVELGNVNILDSRRFNDKLVFYTDLNLQPAVPVQQQQQPQGFPGGGAAPAIAPIHRGAEHRSLRVFTLGDKLVEELHDTLIDTTVSAEQLINQGVDRGTPVGTVVNEARRFGSNMWASDHYFVVTEEINKTKLSGWQTNQYFVCTQSHVVPTSYTHCTTKYEERPNPNYVPPDNSAGDRACKGVTLADCLRQVSRVSSKTIQVAVGQECVERQSQTWVCDRQEPRMYEYPTFAYEAVTQLYIYEYAPEGFVRLDARVSEITNQGLSALALEDSVPVLTTSAETFDLAVPGSVQTLQFQGGFLYVISQGVLQVYSLDGASLVRTATLSVVNDTLQSSLFSEDKLFLSDFGYRGSMDQSTLKVVDLSNPAFPRIEGATHSLPGGHSSILASRHGIFTIGAVHNFDGESINAVKLGLFSSPYAVEEAYLILATELANTWLGNPDDHFFSGPEQRLLLPYWGQDDRYAREYRVSVSRVVPGEILSEGAVRVPEPVQRVRAADAAQHSFLTFADSSIYWLTPKGAEWQSQPVLEYFKPFALLRLNDADDYAEVQRLGDRCKVFQSNASGINQRDGGILSEAFACSDAGIRAYDHTLLLADSAVEFDAKGALRVLSAAERSAIEAKIAMRETCLLSTEPVDNPVMDYTKSYDRSQFTCVSPTELQMLIAKNGNAGGVPGGGAIPGGGVPAP